MSNEWIDVPDDAVINEPNRAGRTMVCRGRWALNSLLHAGQHDLIRAIALLDLPPFSECVVCALGANPTRNLPAGHRYLDGGQGIARRFVAPRWKTSGEHRRISMCDYSLHAVASRPAKVRESLVSTSFCGTSTRGFAAKDEPAVAVCLLPGTELTFEQDVRYNRNWLLTKSAGFRVAQFCVTQPKAPEQHHDAMLFPDGTIVLVNLLSEGEHTQVLQLPATPLGEVGARAEHAPVYSIQQVDRVQIHLLSSLMSPGADN